ncbi:CapA family protein [uncultured Helicobacter sp.]|uniref:CapA family protein n=1 Tax=uncultured Helicobacter sp. TaxID=175537 RepID=UPI001C39FD0F|nr:CapA family protein [Candidatus Helicobacter avicola]
MNTLFSFKNLYSFSLIASIMLIFSACVGPSTPSSSATDSQHALSHSRGDTITISFVGDCVLGDYKGASGATFNAKFKEVGGDYSYFSKGVREVLGNDDLSVGNLEGVLTDSNLNNAFVKPFSFKGPSRYTNILKSASIESVNIANNHTRDYGTQGFKDTVAILTQANIAHFGEGILDVREIKGRKFGFAGHRGWNPAIKHTAKKEIQSLRAKGAEVVIFVFHWGEEREHIANKIQREIAHFVIDSGADLIIGHHPHVLQGIEEYKGKKIVYSLGNFIYGGAKNPKDKDTMIYQVEFRFYNDSAESKTDFETLTQDSILKAHYVSNLKPLDKWERQNVLVLHRIIPANISSQNAYNDYSPRIYPNGSEEYKRVLRRVSEYSRALEP